MSIYYEDWRTSDPQFRKALEINPRSSLIQGYYGIYLAVARRFEEAILQAEIALDLDPLSHFAHALAGITLFLARQPERGVKAAERGLDLQSDNALALWALGLSLSALEEHDAAVRAMERVLEFSHRAPLFLGLTGLVCARAGQEDRARRLLSELEQPEGHYVSPACALFTYVGLEDWAGIRQQGRKCVEDEASPLSLAAGLGPWGDPLFQDPEMRDLLHKLRLPDPSESKT